jgi:hypothetical protein
MSCGSSVSIVSDYNWTTEVWCPEEAKEFSSSLSVQTSYESHPASCPMGTGGKTRPGREADRLVPRLQVSRS